jgi:type 1 glutamine amidotransferase
MGADHPIAWCQEIAGGRAIYTAGGHTRESYTEPLFVAHLAGAVRWAAGLEPGDCGPGERVAPRRIEQPRRVPRVVTPR